MVPEPKIGSFTGFMRRNSAVKPALTEDPLQISLQDLRLKRVSGGECMIIYTAVTATVLDKT